MTRTGLVALGLGWIVVHLFGVPLTTGGMGFSLLLAVGMDWAWNHD